MGSISQHDVGAYVDKYKLENYIETGTGWGECLAHALKFPFKQLRSVEIYPQVYDNVAHKFAHIIRCKILLGNSYEVLPDILKETEGNVLFFLDAHFPGADFHFETYASETDYNKRIPLERELETICANRDTKNDVFIIDDLRVYEDNDYTDEEGNVIPDGNWPHREELGGDGIDFVYTLLGETHNVTKDLRHQGFLIITPKQ